MLRIRYSRLLISSYNITLAFTPILSIIGLEATSIGPIILTSNLGVTIIYP